MHMRIGYRASLSAAAIQALALLGVSVACANADPLAASAETGPGEVVRAYVDAVGRKDFDRVASLLDADVRFSTPGGNDIHGAQAYVAALRRLAPILQRNDIKRVFVDGDDVCIIYDFVTDASVGPIPSVEWVAVSHGKVHSVQLIFHSQPWPTVLQELKKRSTT